MKKVSSGAVGGRAPLAEGVLPPFRVERTSTIVDDYRRIVPIDAGHGQRQVACWGFALARPPGSYCRAIDSRSAPIALLILRKSDIGKLFNLKTKAFEKLPPDRILRGYLIPVNLG